MSIQKYMKGLKLSFTFISLGILLAFTSAVAIAKAQEEDFEVPIQPPSSLQEQAEQRRAEIEARRASTTTEIEERKQEAVNLVEERRAALTTRTQERITNLAANMSNRMEAAIQRIGNIATRMEKRVSILADRGVDTAEAITHIEAARNSLQEATNLLSDIDSLVFDATTSENPRELWPGVRQVYVDVKNAIQSAHTSLREALAALKVAVAETETGNGVSDAVRADNSLSTSSASNTVDQDVSSTTTETE